MSANQFTRITLASDLIVLLDMDKALWTLDGFENILWFNLTPYFKRFIRIASNDVIFSLALTQSFESLRIANENSLSASDNGQFSFQWYDPKLAPFTLIIASASPNIEIKPEQYSGANTCRFTATSMGMQVEINQCSYKSSGHKYYVLMLTQENGEQYQFGKFATLDEARIIGDDLVSDPNSHPPMPEGDFNRTFSPVILANSQTYYFHEAIVDDEAEPSFQWLVSRSPVEQNDVLTHTKFSYYRKNGLSNESRHKIHYLGDINAGRLIARAAASDEFIKSIEKAFNKELA